MLMRLSRSEGDLPDRLQEIATLDRGACTLRWQDAFGSPPPKYASVRFMQRMLARDLQIRVVGDYPAQIRRELKSVAGASRRGDATPPNAAPGTYLVREWNGRTYRVEVTSGGYVFDGQTY
ncbi:MAG: DUF2924 domain-containing protein, partial [Rhodobacteraceae bacterium]|nr:DUF2924 domain-containing protein [Paracoccaceae bacterium]